MKTSARLMLSFVNGKQLTILCNRIEETLDLTPVMKSKFIWLLYNEPETFAELYLSGELQDFLERYGKSCAERESLIRAQLEKLYSPQTTLYIAREFIMHDN